MTTILLQNFNDYKLTKGYQEEGKGKKILKIQQFSRKPAPESAHTESVTFTKFGGYAVFTLFPLYSKHVL